MSFTPMIKQYRAIRSKLSTDTVLFFRLGDFYEMFFEDAKTASSILDITLTSRDAGPNNRVPMCGIPYHSAQGYINRLTRAGFKVAICEQVEDPKLSKGIVKREVVRIITPATNLEDDFKENNQFSYIAAIHPYGKTWGMAWLDLGTGDFKVGEFADIKDLEDELIRLNPVECIVSEKLDRTVLKNFFQLNKPVINEQENWVFDINESADRILKHFNTVSLNSFGIGDLKAGTACAGAIIYYLRDNLNKSPGHLKKPSMFQSSKFMTIDRNTMVNLEILDSSSRFNRGPTLYRVLDRTITPMGARLLSLWIRQPLTDASLIRKRFDAVEEILSSAGQLKSLRDMLKPVKDIERLLARINCGTPSARDIVALGFSLKAVPLLKGTLQGFKACLIKEQILKLVDLTALTEIIERAFIDTPPVSVRDGGFIRNGYNRDLDELRNISRNAREWIAELQRREAEKTGIKSLKIKYNRVFGYYIEITKANLSMVPEYYIRKQTLANSERFIVPELKEYEEKILGAEEKARDLEYILFEEIRNKVLSHTSEIQKTAEAIANLDVLASHATTAIDNHYCKPEVNETGRIYIAGSRHPVVEQMLEPGCFVDNDVVLDNDENQLLIITGPNMAGKSTFIRQVALIVLMAQTGSFVPARIAKIGIVDRIFSRIGASDNLARGESTFMVEMIETANILNNATTRSLLIFDEIGRGTSTFDGVSIAWAVCEHINRDNFRPKCLFATHYHELTELGDHHSGIKNFNVTVKEIENDILFLRKVVPGGADRSYGIHVAKLAGLPMEIIKRAGEILLCLEEEKISDESITEILKKKRSGATVYDLPLFKPLKKQPLNSPAETPIHVPDTSLQHSIIRELKEIDVSSLTPLQALIKIDNWKKEVENNAFVTKGNGGDLPWEK